MEDVWDEMDLESKILVGEALGAIVSVVHSTSADPLEEIESASGGTMTFADHWRRRMTDIIEGASDVPLESRRAIIQFLSNEAEQLVSDSNTLVHRELTNDHVYVEKLNGRWQLSGIIDWADSMVGPEEWDISFVWLYTLNRHRPAMSRFMSERYPDGPREGLGRRCMGAVLQTYDGPDLWDELRSASLWDAADPVEAMACHLFPEEIFGG